MYIDLFFLENFMMDSILLMVCAILLHLPLTRKKLILGAICGSIGSCLTTLCLPKTALPANVCTGLVICFFMTAIAFPCKSRSGKILRIFAVYGTSFLLRGILYWLTSMGLPLWAVFFCSLLLLFAGQWCINQIQNSKSLYCNIHLQWNQRTVTLSGYMDTGNQLQDPTCGKPVMVSDLHTMGPYLTTAARKLLACQTPSQLPGDGNGLLQELPGFHYVPYHTVSTSLGVLPVIMVDTAVIEWKDTSYILHHIPLAISSDHISNTRQYQILINPKICNRLESI